MVSAAERIARRVERVKQDLDDSPDRVYSVRRCKGHNCSRRFVPYHQDPDYCSGACRLAAGRRASDD